jgi:hypothetical protein
MSRWDDVIEALSMPPDVRVDQRVPKTLLVTQGAPTPADARAIQQGLDELVWVAALKPDRIGVLPYRDEAREYAEVVVAMATHRTAAKVARLSELIHRAIPYPLVLVTRSEGAVTLSLAHKRESAVSPGKVVLDGMVLSATLAEGDVDAEFLRSLALGGLPRGDLFALYQGCIDRLHALRVARLTGTFSLPRSAAEAEALQRDLAQHGLLATQLGAMRKVAAREQQLRRKVEYNLAVRDLQNRLDDLVSAMRGTSTAP